MMLCVRADGVETAGHRGPNHTIDDASLNHEIGSAGSLP